MAGLNPANPCSKGKTQPMIVSREKRFVFVHIPKTAGKSMNSAFAAYSSRGLSNRLHIHESITEFYRRLRKEGGRRRRPPTFRRSDADISAEFADFYKFAFVRNPWDRAVSMYGFLAKIGLPETEGLTFEKFVSDLYEGAHYMHSIHVPRQQIEFISDYRGKVIVDRVGRFENLATDFAEICDHLGIDTTLEKRNTSSRGPYEDYYNDQTRAMVGEIYAPDIEAFGYAFGE